jgi:TonB family protein
MITMNPLAVVTMMLLSLTGVTDAAQTHPDTETAKGMTQVQAEATYRDAFAAHPKSLEACTRLAEFLIRPPAGAAPRFDEGMAVFERCASLGDPGDRALHHQTIAMVYWDKAYKDATLTDEQKVRYADRGLEHVTRALQIKPNLIDAIVFKGLFLRVKAMVAKDTRTQQAYLQEAAQLQKQAMDLKRSGKGEMSGAAPPLPVAPAPSADGGVTGGVVEGWIGGGVGGTAADTIEAPAPPPPPAAVRVGGQIKEPRKIKHVEFVYPEIARSARVQGVVIMECTISAEGKVIDVRVLRSIPLLDGAAIEAVKQWEYTPTILNGVPVPVIMTITANFKLS